MSGDNDFPRKNQEQTVVVVTDISLININTNRSSRNGLLYIYRVPDVA